VISRQLFTQFQNVAPNDLEQFRAGNKQVILWPAEYRAFSEKVESGDSPG
jgi:hypothetical protein